MKQQFQLQAVRVCIFAVGMCIAFASTSFGKEGQQHAFDQAEAVVREASDASLGRGATGGMGAMAALGAGNYSAAASGGLDAYGKYRNSGNQDLMGDIYNLRSIRMGSTASLMRRYREHKRTRTTFSRLKPDFLYEGEAAVVARQWEELSGMPREQFLQALGQATDNPISRSDPNLFAESKARLMAFIETVPNPEFRNSLRENVNKLAIADQMAFFNEGLANYSKHLTPLSELDKQSLLAVAIPGSVSDELTPAEKNSAMVSLQADLNAPAEKNIASVGTSANVVAPKKFVKQGEYFDVDDLKPAEDSKSALYASALDQLKLAGDARNRTIFEMVSNRYKELNAAGFGRTLSSQ